VSPNHQRHISVAVEDLWAYALEVDWVFSDEVTVEWLELLSGVIPLAVEQEEEYLPSFLTEPAESDSSNRAIRSSVKTRQSRTIRKREF
jgi:hypothetical protein